jgi:hypothetical protein
LLLVTVVSAERTDDQTAADYQWDQQQSEAIARADGLQEHSPEKE